MKLFSERDVRRQFEILQHDPEFGLTELKAVDGDHVIGIGLFDNVDDFSSECLRYNELGTLYVGVNPRSLSLLDDYGGLKNRMRTLFSDVVEEKDVPFVTGLAMNSSEGLSESARALLPDVSILGNGDLFWPMDEPIPVEQDGEMDVRKAIAAWFYGDPGRPMDISQFTRVMGTAIPGGSWLNRRTRFKKFRPFILEGIASRIIGE